MNIAWCLLHNSPVAVKVTCCGERHYAMFCDLRKVCQRRWDVSLLSAVPVAVHRKGRFPGIRTDTPNPSFNQGHSGAPVVAPRGHRLRRPTVLTCGSPLQPAAGQAGLATSPRAAGRTCNWVLHCECLCPCLPNAYFHCTPSVCPVSTAITHVRHFPHPTPYRLPRAISTWEGTCCRLQALWPMSA